MKIEIELPDGVLGGFVNYVYSTNTGLIMGTTAMDTDQVKSGHIVCKGSALYEE